MCMKHRALTTTEQGFTLIEALVAISVMLLSIAGPMQIASDGIKNSMYARDQIVAFYIAQEGVEIVRSIRDQNALANPFLPWLTGISPLCSGAAGCGIDIQNKNFIDCAGNAGAACNIFYNAGGLNVGGQRGIYGHTIAGGTATIFKRSIKIVTINAQESTIDVSVSWISRGVTKTILVQSRMFNQYDNLGTVN